MSIMELRLASSADPAVQQWQPACEKADMLIASGEDTLPETAEGFTEEGDQWVKQVGNTLITVKMNMSETGFGRMREGTVSLTEQGEVLAELDISRYLPKEGAI